MKPNLLSILLLFLFYPALYAADYLRMGDIRSIGMGGNEATTSALFNPALLVLYEHSTLRINYFNGYGLKELGCVNGGFYLPNKVLSLGVEASSFGYEAYREHRFRLLTAKRLNSRWTLGVGVRYALFRTEWLEEQPGRLSVDIGLTYRPGEHLLVGLLILDIPSDAEDWLQAGFQWEVAKDLFLSAALSMGGVRAIGGSLGLEYTVFRDFTIRAGVRGEPLLPSLGLGYRLGSFKVDAAAVYHPVLGVSKGVGLSFSF
jgi:hypothetical protein